MVSVLSGRNLILELSLKVGEKKTSFFFEEAEGRREKNLFYLRRPKVESPKLDCGPERTDTILLKQLFNAKLLLVIKRLQSCSVPKITIVRHV